MELTSPTLFASYCHCESCRRVHGAPFVAWTAVPLPAFRLTAGDDEVAIYASSRGVARAFCRRCGTPLFYRGDDTPDRIYVPVAILDRLDRPVDAHVSYEERADWLRDVERLPCFEGKSETQLRWH